MCHVEACVLQVNGALLCHPKEQNHFHRLYIKGLLHPGPSLAGLKVVTIIGAHGWGSQPTGWGQPKKMLGRWRATAARRHESLSFACVFQPCPFKHSKEFKAFKHKTWKSPNEYSCHVRCTRREPRLTDSNTEPSSPSRQSTSQRKK